MASEEHRAIIERWMYEVFAQGNMGTLDELLAPDFVSLDPSSRTYRTGSRCLLKNR